MMLEARIVIIGGGLSGLYAATLLEERGVKDYVLMEARNILGGRVMSVPKALSAGSPRERQAPVTGRFDMGATWFWPAMHPELQALVDRLGLAAMAQHENGDMLVERSANAPPSRVGGYSSAPPALRLKDGMGSLTDALADRLSGGALLTGHQVMRLQRREGHIDIEAENSLGRRVVYHASRVLLAVPPRLAAGTIEFIPALSDTLLGKWRACGTWMAPHAKYLAVFDTPFWRERGLSGEARSYVGPMVEIHDASAQDGGAALFGFLGLPAQRRRQISETVLLSLCRAQLARLFGDEAAEPKMEFLKDWAGDPYTAVSADHEPDVYHSVRPPVTPVEHPWRNRVVGIASEWSPNFPGYLAGALEAARLGVEALLADKPVISPGLDAGGTHV